MQITISGTRYEIDGLTFSYDTEWRYVGKIDTACPKDGDCDTYNEGDDCGTCDVEDDDEDEDND